MRKFLMGVLATTFACALAVTPAPNAAADESTDTVESIAATNVSIDYVHQVMTINAGSNLEVGFSIATVKGEDSSLILTPAKDDKWEWYDVTKTTEEGNATGSVTIDLSTLSNVKDNYIQIKGDKSTTTTTIKIPAAVKKIKGTYTYESDSHKITFTDGKDELPSTNSYQFKTQYGEWQTYTATASDGVAATDLSSYAYRGAKLTFRIAPSANGSVIGDSSTNATIAKTEEKEPIYEAGSFPSKEVKVTIKKLANAPKATADYVNNKIKLPKGCVYRFTASDDKELGKWSETATTKAESIDLATISKNVAGVLEVRKPADAKKKTAASKVSRLEIAKVETSTAAVNTTITVTQDNVKNKATLKNITTGTTAKTYQVIVSDTKLGDGDTVGEITDQSKVTGTILTIRSGGSKVVDIAEQGEDEKIYYVYVREAGDKKVATWTTLWTETSFTVAAKTGTDSNDSE